MFTTFFSMHKLPFSTDLIIVDEVTSMLTDICANENSTRTAQVFPLFASNTTVLIMDQSINVYIIKAFLSLCDHRTHVAKFVKYTKKIQSDVTIVT